MEDLYSGSDNIFELTKKDFNINQEVTLKKEFCQGIKGIIITYAPWCSHCILSKEMWLNLSNLFKYKFNFYALNTYNFEGGNQDLVKPLNINIYPSYFIINKDGSLKKYKGGRTENDFVEMIMANLK